MRESSLIKELGFDKVYLLSTLVHADHITGDAMLKDELGKDRSQSVLSNYYGNARADILVGEEDESKFGALKLNFLHTPDHTSGCLCIVDQERTNQCLRATHFSLEAVVGPTSKEDPRINCGFESVKANGEGK